MASDVMRLLESQKGHENGQNLMIVETQALAIKHSKSTTMHPI